MNIGHVGGSCENGACQGIYLCQKMARWIMCQKMEQSQRKNMNPNYLIELINRAAKKAGSDAALARELEVSRSRIGDWRHGRTTCPPADVALMAAVAGLDAEAWAARAVISQHEGTAKGVKLEAALKKAFVATGAALVSFGATAAENVAYFIRCIDCQQEDRRMTFVF